MPRASHPTTVRGAFLLGLRLSAPFLLVVCPFALLFGVLGMEAGLGLAQVMGFSVLVIAGASQLTALQLMTEGAPTLVVLASALAVNLRMAMYSASLAPWIGAAPLWQRAVAAYLLVDQSYAIGVSSYETAPQMTVPQRMALFFGTVALIAPLWYVFTLAGALLGQRVPEALALDFAVPVAFLALIAPGLRTLAHLAAALSAIVLALAFAWMPFNTGLLVAAPLAMAVGAEVERRGLARPVGLGRSAT
jgi:predicted branched-subunit amino acid permease